MLGVELLFFLPLASVPLRLQTVVSIDLFSVFFMPFLYNGIYYPWSNRLPPPPPPTFHSFEPSNSLSDNLSSLTLL